MKKIAFLFVVTSILIGSFLSDAYSLDLQIKVTDSECVDGGKIVAHYAVVNNYGHDFNNVTLGFKLMDGENVIACKRLKMDVPEDADGSETDEIVFDVPCAGASYDVVSSIFYATKTYKIDEWFSGCE